MSVVLSWVGGVGQVEVERRLLQHLLVAPVVVLAVGGEQHPRRDPSTVLAVACSKTKNKH